LIVAFQNMSNISAIFVQQPIMVKRCDFGLACILAAKEE
jgi:hypothetical protein